MFALLYWLFGFGYPEEDVVQNVIQAQGCTAPVPVPTVEELEKVIANLKRVE